MRIKDWLREISYEVLQGSLEVEVEEVVYDSRKACPGAVFVCMRYTPLKKLHPVAFIAAAAVIGAVFQF